MIAPFQTLSACALSLPDANVDTDIIFPARFLLIPEKRGLGRYAFHDKRAAAGFPLDAPRVQDARILITGDNFGCGSSREQAPWALHDLGFVVLIGPSFGEIFQSNCFKNGMLAITLPAADVERLHAAARADRVFTIDLDAQKISVQNSLSLAFQVHPARREALLQGWDEIARIRSQFAPSVTQFESSQKVAAPWLWRTQQGKFND